MSVPYQSTFTGAQVDTAIAQSLAAGRIVTGSYSLPEGSSSGSVTGLDLSFTPERVLFTIESPTAGGVMFGVVIADSLSRDGFDFALSAETDASTYVLHYIIIGPV